MNGGLTLGARGVTVVLDGKVTNMSAEQLYSLLKSMPASRIEWVEVMYNAPARYQVRGALINVRLRHRIGDPGSVQGEAFAKYDNGTRLRSRSVPPYYITEESFRRISFIRMRTARATIRPTKRRTTGRKRRVRLILSGTTRGGTDGTHTHTFRLGAGYRFAENSFLGFCL